MSNKFYMLGKYEDLHNDVLSLKVRRNFRDHDGRYTYFLMKIKIGICISELLLNSLKEEEIVHVQGRIETEEDDSIELIAEHILKVSSLN